MQRKPLYPIAKNLEKMCEYLDVSSERVLRRAGFSIDLMANEGKGIPAEDYLTLWQTLFDETKDHALILKSAIVFARGSFSPPLLAFSCSPNIEEGLKRLGLFKPLIGPMRLKVKTDAQCLNLQIELSESNLSLPQSLCFWELVFYVECFRTFTGETIQPVRVGSPFLPNDDTLYQQYFGIGFEPSEVPTISITLSDARRRLISENESLWSHFEPQLQRQLLNSEDALPLSQRTRNALLELLPGGKSSIEDVCERLRIGRRTFQRQLKSEGKTFSQILDEVREELSLHYLKQQDISIDEISYLLAFKEPNSFYRAFQAWTGMTPTQARERCLH